jgi:hypothetical protein
VIEVAVFGVARANRIHPVVVPVDYLELHVAANIL